MGSNNGTPVPSPDLRQVMSPTEAGVRARSGSATNSDERERIEAARDTAGKFHVPLPPAPAVATILNEETNVTEPSQALYSAVLFQTKTCVVLIPITNIQYISTFIV
jgi:hypothetical protein